MESSKLSLWLQTIGLSSCCKPLWDAGFRDLESVASVTEVQLKEAGVDKKTANKLLWEIDRLNDPSTTGGLGSPTTCAITAGQQASIYRALHDYDGNEDTDLRIQEGDFVVVLDTSRKDKWKGLVNQCQGFFPPWVVVENPRFLYGPGTTSDHSEREASLPDKEKTKRQHSTQQTTYTQTLLQVSTLPEPDSDEKSSLADANHAVRNGTAEVLGSDDTFQRENEQSVNGNTEIATTSPQSNALSDLQLDRQGLDTNTNTTAVADPSQDTSEPSVPQISSIMTTVLPSSSHTSDVIGEPVQMVRSSDARLTEGNSAVTEVQSGNDAAKQENGQRSVNGNTATAFRQNCGQSGSELISRESDAGITAVSDSSKHTAQSDASKSTCSSNDVKHPSSLSSATANRSDEHPNGNHQSSGENRSNQQCSGSGITGSSETTGATKTTASSSDCSASDGSPEKKPEPDSKTSESDRSGQMFQVDSNDENIKDGNQKQDEESSSIPPPSLSEDCPGVQVEFHVIIHEEWKFDPVEEDKSVSIRFGVDELGCWKWNCVHMESAAKDFGTTERLRLIGHFIVPKDITHKTIPYKYVVISKRGTKSTMQTEFEYITEGHHHGNMNRALVIPDNLKGKTIGFFRKYDDIIRKQPKKWRGTVNRQFTSDESTDSRKWALEAMLPRWPGFCGVERASPIHNRLTAEQAFQEFDSVVNSIKFVPLWEDNQPESDQRSFRPKGFTDATIAEIICRHITPQLEALSKPLEETGFLLSSAVALSVLVHRYYLSLIFDQLVALLRALKIHPDMETRRCYDYEVLITQIQDLKIAADGVEYVIKVSCVRQWDRPFEWVLALPVLHFLRGDLAPFGFPETADLGTPQWWGLENLINDVKAFRKSQTSAKSPLILLDEVKPLCSADRLTTRSFLYSLNLQQLARVVEADIGHPSELVQALENKLTNMEKGTTMTKQTIEMIDNFLKKLSAMTAETELSDSYLDLTFAQTLNECGVIACVQLLHTMATRSKEKEILNLLQRAKVLTFRFLYKMTITGEAIAKASQDETFGGNARHRTEQFVYDSTRLQLQETFRSFSEWMDRNSVSSLRTVESIVEELKVWNKLLQSDILPKGLKQQWDELVLAKLNNRIGQAKEVPIVEAYCWASDNTLHPIIVKCFEDLTERTVDRLLQQRGAQEQTVCGLVMKFISRLNSGDHFATLLKLVLRKSCPGSSTTTAAGWSEWFIHLLSWPLWTTFLRLTGKASHRRDFLGAEGHLVLQAESVLIGTETRLRKRSITVAQLRRLEKNVDRFMELCEVWDSHQKDTKVREKARSSFRARMVEIEKFEQEKRLVDKFVGACVSVCTPGNGGASEELRLLSHRLKEDISSMEIRSLCHFDTKKTTQKPYFPLPPTCRQYLQPIGDALDSNTFRRIWEETARGVAQKRRSEQPPNMKPLILSEIADLICSPVISQWQRLCLEVQDGSICLERVSVLFGCLASNRGALKQELNCISVCSPRRGKSAWKQQRQEQIEQYSKLRDRIEAAQTLKSVVRVLEISRSFKEIDAICDQDSPEFQQQPISTISGDLLCASIFLATFTNDLVRCLKSFASAPNLVRWLRQEIRERKELETFVDLAEAKSLEEGDLETVKVTHLHAACDGFAPLLFDVDKITKFQYLQERCQTVFSSFSRDKELISKWISTEKCLEEFKFTRTYLGEVEKSSFSQLEMINSRGRYQVGCLESNSISSRSLLKLTTEDCVRVVIEADGQEYRGYGTVYRLSDLLDLQSKLMLISARDDRSEPDSLNVFVNILDHAITLANVYIEISKAGHEKFLNWKCEFRCMKGSSRHLRPTNDVDARVKELNKLLLRLDSEIQKLTDALRRWLEQVESLRGSHYYLNYFTTPQLLILRQHLGKMVCNSQYPLSGEVFSLLGSVNPSCSQQRVTQVLSLECGLSKLQSKRRLEDSVASLRLLPHNDSDVRHITDMGFSADSAVATLKASNGDLGTAVMLCRETEPNFHGDRYEGGDVLFVVSNPLLSDQGSYISLDILGRILEQLAPSSSSSPDRPFAEDQFRLGEPNLLVIPHNELFLGILSLYMRELHVSLPSAQEVLLCSSSTSVEEVCLFWRRVLGDPGHRRLFCLAMADHLSYEVSRKSWEEFNRLTQDRKSTSSGSPYKAVILCSAENSYMVELLDPYRRAGLPLPSVEEVQSYLKQMFKLPVTPRLRLRARPPSAASLDHENSSVRVISSNRAGGGKSFFIDSIANKLTTLPHNQYSNSPLVKQVDQTLHIVVPLHDHKINRDTVLESLRPLSPCPDVPLARLIHFDILFSTSEGLDAFLFGLLVLGEISDSEGYVWRKRPDDLYVIEMTAPSPPPLRLQQGTGSARQVSVMRNNMTARKSTTTVPFADLLPTIHCGSPAEAQEFLAKGSVPGMGDPDMNERQFRDSKFQRAFQYLSRYARGENLDPFKFSDARVEGDHLSCLQTLRSNCGIHNPSWAELKYFVNFLSNQLRDCENNDFCKPEAYGEDLPGFKAFVLKLMILMSRDFATPSLDYQAGADLAGNELVQLRRRWEQSPHPYLFFNEDKHSVTFVEVQITREGRLLDPRSGQALETIMSTELSTALYTQGFRLQENYDNWTKGRKLEELCRVMGVENVHDPDETYELTMDNVKKILAIQMRFRCGIPVIIMGETGCGKTRLVRYMCALQSNLTGAKNMLLMKVHGGVTRTDIISQVKKAEKLAAENCSLSKQYKIQTVLFFDEANTTDSLGLIKEVMCDGRINGGKVEGLGSSLQVIAACNPYRKHTPVMIKRLEEAGLGYHVKSDETEDKLGHIPLRQLVYRVLALPDSMKALVWDFGQLDDNMEKLYIRQIVNRHLGIKQSIPNLPGIVDCITNVLAAAQGFMREQKDECSFVSLRDIERAMMVMVWFYNLRDNLEQAIVTCHEKSQDQLPEESRLPLLDTLTRSLVLALGVCYLARLHDRRSLLDAVVNHFKPPCSVVGGSEQLGREIKYCQDVFLDQLELPPQIARNHALSENVFMMVVCIDLRIPLFLVGKPGSSKSLAKDIVKDAMKGQQSSSKLFQSLKQLRMVSYQCSPLSTADGIIGVFQQCQRQQKERDTTLFVSCVVLDEVGLAEDSPRLPLKALHPLLDDGTAGADETAEDDKQWNRVAFVGLSNWALDPAKMNRGILVNREVPDDEELIVSAQGICSSGDDTVRHNFNRIVDGMASAYIIIYSEQKQKREFFGLRDFYSLVKMVFAFCQATRQCPTWSQLEHSVRRNFGGQVQEDAVEVFRRCCTAVANDTSVEIDDTKDNSAVGLIRANLRKNKSPFFGESRYLLLLTKNCAALNIIRQRILNDNNEDPVIIFGSSFPKDQEYTHLCRTINRIKVCMATGRTVVLLNLDRLYESLYDALNQYYVYHGGERYVDLGLGSHRLKCLVNKNFRLILVAERDVVYKEFPIPLINRMEKHFLAMESVLSPEQQVVVQRVSAWATQFAEINPENHFLRRSERRPAKFGVHDAFIGFNQDAAATVVLQACSSKAFLTAASAIGSSELTERVFDISIHRLLKCATPDAVARLHVSSLSADARKLWDTYFYDQHHSSLLEYLKAKIGKTKPGQQFLLQVTTHSRLLSPLGVSEIRSAIGIEVESLSLQQFDTEQQFEKRLKEFYKPRLENESVLLVQCEAGDMNSELIACSRYLIQEKHDCALKNYGTRFTCIHRRHLVFVIQLPRVSSGCFVGFQGGAWDEVHIDELRPANQALAPSITSLASRKISSLLGSAVAPTSGDPVVDFALNEACEYTGTLTEEPPMLNAEAVLRACVHGAVSRLDNQKESLENATRRIHILLQLIPGGPQVDVIKCQLFYKQLKWQVIRLLQERDCRIEANAATDWVRNEALSHSSLQVGGTFRRALWLRVVNTVTPVLAEIIAFLDRNFNLQLISEAIARASNWLTGLWLDIFNSSLVSQHRYDFLSPVQNEVGQRVLVQSSGFHNHLFHAQFPFSCVIKSEVDGLFQEARRIAAETHEKIHLILQRLFDASEFGEIVSKAQQSGQEVNEEMSLRYLHDFVHMVYYGNSVEEYKLVESAILSGLWELAGNPDDSSNPVLPLNPTIPIIHAAFEHVRSRLYCFRDFVRLHPKVVTELHKRMGDFHRQELLTDVMAATVLLELFSPITALNNVEQRDQWVKNVQAAKPVLDACLAPTFPGAMRNALCEMNRNVWAVYSAVRLFAEHTHTLVQDPFVFEAAFMLYQRIEDLDVDFTKAGTILVIQRFLNECSKEYATKLFGPNGEECVICHTQWMNKNPVVLPCRHTFCSNCLKGQLERKRACPLCMKKVRWNFKPPSNDKLIVSSQAYRSFKRCSTTFFMELVSVYSFSETDPLPPERELVRNLMELVVQGPLSESTRPFSPFQEDAIDPRPVVRSFILQLLLKYNLPVTLEYVEMAFANARRFIRGDTKDDLGDLIVLFVDCIEDSLHQRSCRSSVEERISAAVDELKDSTEKLRAEKYTVRYLQGVAGARFGLAVTSEALGDLIIDDVASSTSRERREFSLRLVPPNAIPPSIRQLFSAVEVIYRGIEEQQLGLFLVKQLVRSKGLDVVEKLQEKYSLETRWLKEILPQDTDEPDMPDNFVILGQPYKRFREVVARMVQSGETRYVEDLIKKESRQDVAVCLLLAIYREITSVNALAVDRQIPTRTLTLIEKYCNKCGILPTWGKALATDLVNNSQGGTLAQLRVSPGLGAQTRALAGLALHIFIAVSIYDGSGLLQPLRLMLTQPGVLANSFWPTMPEDYYLEARNVVQGTRWYECKNGHPYLVLDCGNPEETQRCADCGEAIGKHTGDRDARQHAATQTGHVLGPVNRRSQDAAPERDLSPSACALIRLLMHGVLTWTSCRQDKNISRKVADVVTPRVPQEGLPSFFWAHFELDTHLFAKAIGRSVEDAVIVCHILLQRITNSRFTRQERVGDGRLVSMQERKDWEAAFSRKYIAPVFQEMQTKMTDWLQEVMNDQKLGKNSVIRQIYELEQPIRSNSPPRLWRYRVRVSIDHLTHTLEQNMSACEPNQCLLLREFLKQEPKLRALQYLPDVVKLQRLLMDKYDKRISLQEALMFRVGRFLDSIQNREETLTFQKLIESFNIAWSLVREHVLSHGRLKPKKKEHELLHISKETPLAYLLPRPVGEGTCAVALVDYLINSIHNEFLTTYRRLSGHEWEPERVPINFVTRAHLVAYDVQKDLMPLVLAHCDYSLSVGEGTNITYNLAALERQIVDRFVNGKPHVEMKDYRYRIAFRKDVYNSSLFVRLKQRITQEELTLVVQRQITFEFHHLTDVCSVLAVLDVVIGFIVSAGGSSDMLLHKYIHDTLKMPQETGLVSIRAQQQCRLKHVFSLWRLLTLEKGRRLCLANQEPFEHVAPVYRQEMDPATRRALLKALRKVNIDTFLLELVEIITLELHGWQETPNMEHYELRLAMEELYGSVLRGLDHIPSQVQLKHLLHCWKVAVKFESEPTSTK